MTSQFCCRNYRGPPAFQRATLKSWEWVWDPDEARQCTEIILSVTIISLQMVLLYISSLSVSVSNAIIYQLQCNQAREQNFFISEFEPIKLFLAHKIKSIIDKSLKFGTNLLQHKLYIEFNYGM